MERFVQKEQREEQILLSLKKLDYLSRSQLQKLHDLGGERNARRVLADMEPYLSYFRDSEKIYYLSKEGRERIGCDKLRKKTLQARHFLMRNDLYIAFNRPQNWKNEMKIIVKDLVTVVADALFKDGGKWHIVEVDHLQKMSKNREKVDRYKKIRDSKVFQEQYGHFPQLIWITTTEHRRNQLDHICKGFDVKIYTVEDLK